MPPLSAVELLGTNHDTSELVTECQTSTIRCPLVFPQIFRLAIIHRALFTISIKTNASLQRKR